MSSSSATVRFAEIQWGEGPLDLSGLFPTVEEYAALSPERLLAVLRDIEKVRRCAEVAMAEGVWAVGRSGIWADDGYRNHLTFVEASLGVSRSLVRRWHRNGEVVAQMAVLRQAARRGLVGTDRLDDLGRVSANPRVDEHLARCDDLLTDAALTLDYPEWRLTLARFEALADPDGAARRHENAEHNRRASLYFDDEGAELVARGGTADGLLMREILDQYARCEFESDWATARARLGDGVSASQLGRTDRQRRYDAVKAIFAAAAGARASDEPDIDITVNLLCDPFTAEELLRHAATSEQPAVDVREFVWRRCESVDGVHVSHDHMLAALLVGGLRRVLIDRGVVVDLGRRSRLFRLGAKEAAELGDRGCFWPGCHVPTRNCETDHSVPWSHGGSTNPENAGQLCAHHNRWKHHHGYSTHRDETGRWRVIRRDGTELGWRPSG